MKRLGRFWRWINSRLFREPAQVNEDGKGKPSQGIGRISPQAAQSPKLLKTARMEELPETLDPTLVYVLGQGNNVWFVAMICPCGCGATLQMSLLPEAKPRWRLHDHQDGTISLYPSIWHRIGCRSHFVLRRGRVEWCKTDIWPSPA